VTWFMTGLDYFRDKGRAYKLIPEAVLEDLALFCRANETCFHEDARMHAVAEGRRDVWLRIQRFRNMTPSQLMDYFTREKPVLTSEGNPNG
jgi:hypothetical protein